MLLVVGYLLFVFSPDRERMKDGVVGDECSNLDIERIVRRTPPPGVQVGVSRTPGLIIFALRLDIGLNDI